jgi:hypothetical protein
MARKPPSMPPPEHGPAVVIGISPKKPGDGSAPSPDGDGGDAGKASPHKAIVITADSHCKDCQNYHSDTGECDKVQGSFEPEDACHAYFSPMSGGDESEPDADEMGGPPDNDADDSASGSGYGK